MSSVASVINKNLCCEQIYTLILLRELFNYPERFSLLLPCNSSVCVCVWCFCGQVQLYWEVESAGKYVVCCIEKRAGNRR